MTAFAATPAARSKVAVLPLEGLQVARIGTSRAAELLCMLFEEQGATVAVLDPSGDPPYALCTADVVIDPRPLAAPAVNGWSMHELQAHCAADVIYCSLPSFSSLEPALADQRVSDELLAAMTGTYVRDSRGDVRLSSLPISACFTAFSGALAVVAALIARQRDGAGQVVEVPEFDATFLAIGVRALIVNRQRAAERPSEPWGGPFRCKDGRYVWMNLATAKSIRRFVAEVGLLKEWAQEGFLSGSDMADLSQMSPSRYELRRRVVALMETRTAAEWDALAVRVGLAITAVRALDAESVGQDQDLIEGLAKQTTVEVCAVDAETGAAEVTPVQWPDPGVMTELPPLAGVKVVDVSQMLAGPCAGRMLADLGATVVKINDPHEDGAGYRWQENRYHTEVNRGKATVLLDLTTTDGQALSGRLIADADVLIENMRADAAARLGVDEEHIRALAPDICHAHVAAFTLDSRPDAPGYEPSGQAIGGLMLPDAETGVPRLQPCPVNDYGTGLLCAFGVLLSLYRRRRGGAGSYVHASLSQSAFFFARASLARERETGHRGQLVRTADDWVVVDADPEGLADTLKTLGSDPDASIELYGRSVAVCTVSTERLLAECEHRRLPVSRVRNYEEHGRRAELVARGLMINHRYGEEYEITAVGNPLRLLRTPVRKGLWVARPGKDGPAVLAGLSVEAEETARLLADGVVAFG